MDNTTMAAEAEKAELQRRGQAFSRARAQLEKEYNCTVTVTPKWVPNISNTFVLAFDEQVFVGPVPIVEGGEDE